MSSVLSPPGVTLQSTTSRRRAFVLFYANPDSPSFLVGGKSYQRAYCRIDNRLSDSVAYSNASRLLRDARVKHDIEVVAAACGLGVDVRIAARAAIARGTITRYSQSVRVNSDGSKSVETTEEEPGFKERLDALEQFDRITGYA